MNKIGYIDSVATVISGYAFKSDLFNKEGNGLPLIRIRDIDNIQTENYTTQEYKEEHVVQNGEFLIGMDGEFNLASWKGEKAFLNQRVCKLIPDPRKVDGKYLYYYLPKKLKEIEALTSFVTVKHISVKQIKKIKIPLPPLATQHKIAEVLDKADAISKRSKQILERYDQLAQSVFLEMFGDPVKNENGWEEKLMSEICTKVTDGTHDSPKRLDKGMPFITGKHIRPYTIDFFNCDYVSEEDHTVIYKRCNPEIGDVLYTNIGAKLATAALNTMSFEFSMKNVALLKS